MPVVIKAEQKKCQGHARCAAVAARIYSLDNEGYIEFSDKTVPDADKAEAVLGARACPERAITAIVDGTQVWPPAPRK